MGLLKLTCDTTAFVDDLSRRLSEDSKDTEAGTALAEQLRLHISTISTYSHKPRPPGYGNVELDRRGTELWNQCIRLRRDGEDSTDGLSSHEKTALMLTRVLAYQIIDLSQWSADSSEVAAITRLMKLALKAGKCCIGECSI